MKNIIGIRMNNIQTGCFSVETRHGTSLQHRLFVLALFFAFPFLLPAQDDVTLRFTGRDQYGQYVPLGSVYVENVTQRWQEMLYYPDTTLNIIGTGIDDFGRNSDGVRLFQNVPNPFDGVTDFALQLPKVSEVLIEIVGVNGTEVASYKGTLEQGCHRFKAWMTTPQTHLLNVRTDEGTVRIKMLNTGQAGQNRIEYLGQGASLGVENLKNGPKGDINMPFHNGDTMLYKGYANVESTDFESAPVEKAQYGSELIPLTFTLPQPPFYCGIDTVTDYDGNVYQTVEIGQQCWLKENLRTTHYADGTEIPLGTSSSDDTPYRYAPNGNSGNVQNYGYLYNWAAVMHGAATSNDNPSGVQGICPTGWHVPSSTEFSQLFNFVGNQSQYLCGDNNSQIGKALASNQKWVSTTAYPCSIGCDLTANNATGFAAMPAGRFYNTGYYDLEIGAYFFFTAPSAYYCMSAFSQQVQMNQQPGNACSVRCLLDNSWVDNNTAVIPVVSTVSLSDIYSSTASCEGFVTASGGTEVTARGICWSTSPSPSVDDSHTIDGTGTGRFTSAMTGLLPATTYYVRTYTTNSVGTAYGEERSFTTYPADSCGGLIVTDYDGNAYHTVPIGQQCWLRENMRTTHFTDGSVIALGSGSSTTTPYCYAPNGYDSEVPTYGYLYNWVAAMHGATSTTANPSGVQGVCPTGWHVPSTAEWYQLANYVSSQNDYLCGGDSSQIAKALASTKAWYYSDNDCAIGNAPTANNATSFSALPAGHYTNGADRFAEYAFFWTATQPQDSFNAKFAVLLYNDASFSGNLGNTGVNFGLTLSSGASVRCLRD